MEILKLLLGTWLIIFREQGEMVQPHPTSPPPHTQDTHSHPHNLDNNFSPL